MGWPARTNDLSRFIVNNHFKCAYPFALYIRAGHDGTGTRRAVTNHRHRPALVHAVQEPLVCRGGFRGEFIGQCERDWHAHGGGTGGRYLLSFGSLAQPYIS